MSPTASRHSRAGTRSRQTFGAAVPYTAPTALTLLKGEEMEETIEETSRGLEMRLCLNLRNGLHARPAARLAQEAQRYSSAIQLISETGEVDAKSMLDVLSLAPPFNAELTLLAQGHDAREALCGLARLLSTMQD